VRWTLATTLAVPAANVHLVGDDGRPAGRPYVRRPVRKEIEAVSAGARIHDQRPGRVARAIRGAGSSRSSAQDPEWPPQGVPDRARASFTSSRATATTSPHASRPAPVCVLLAAAAMRPDRWKRDRPPTVSTAAFIDINCACGNTLCRNETYLRTATGSVSGKSNSGRSNLIAAARMTRSSICVGTTCGHNRNDRRAVRPVSWPAGRPTHDRSGRLPVLRQAQRPEAPAYPPVGSPGRSRPARSVERRRREGTRR